MDLLTEHVFSVKKKTLPKSQINISVKITISFSGSFASSLTSPLFEMLKIKEKVTSEVSEKGILCYSKIKGNYNSAKAS
jgi:hypothetical protein